MSLQKFLGKSQRVVLGIAFLLALNGCASKPTPPVFSLYGYQRIAVVPFDNQTRDPGLTKDIQDEMTSEVVAVNAVPVIEAAQVGAYLQSLKRDASLVATDQELRGAIAKKFKCDLLLIGSAAGYNEFLKDTMPQRVVVDEKTGEAKWGFYTNRKVVVSANVKLMDPATGSLVWSNKNQGYSWYNTFNPLPIPGEVMIPDQLKVFGDLAVLVKHRVLKEDDREPIVINENNPDSLLYQKSSYFSDLREKAIVQTMSGMTRDFYGHGNWTPQLKGNAE